MQCNGDSVKKQHEYAFNQDTVMRKDGTMFHWCWRKRTEQAAMPQRQKMDPSEQQGRLTRPDRGIPGHVGPEKQLHSGTGYNLVIDDDGHIYGSKEPYSEQAILQFRARATGEVQIKGKKSDFYIAMNNRGKVYAEHDAESENTWFKETYEDGWNNYTWLGNDQDWFLGIKKSGKMKRGPKTFKGQKAINFVPRSAESPSN